MVRTPAILAVGIVALWPMVAVGDGSVPAPAPAAQAGDGLVPGVFDPASGTFQKLAAASGTVTLTGTIKIVGTIVVNAGIPMSATISVSPYFRTANATTINDVFGTTVTAKRTGARSATFSATLPYSCVVPAGSASANISADITTSAAGAGGATISWDGSWGMVVTLPPNGKTLTVKADAAV